MKSKTSFEIENATGLEMTIYHEPEGFEFELSKDGIVSIETDACKESILLKIDVTDGKVGIGILFGKSYYRVLQSGVDVFRDVLE